MLGLSAEFDSDFPPHEGTESDGLEMQALMATFADIGAISVREPFFRKSTELKQIRANERYIRESRHSSKPKWRG